MFLWGVEILLKESNPNDSFATNLRELTGGNVSESIQQLVHSISSDVERIQSSSCSNSEHKKIRQEVLQALARKAVYVMFQIHLIDSLKPTIQSLGCFLGKLIQTLLENDHVQIDWKMLQDDLPCGLPNISYPSTSIGPEVLFSTEIRNFDLSLTPKPLKQEVFKTELGSIVKRGPGRPRKYPVKDPSLPKRKRGRPRKHPLPEPGVPIPKRKRGRPRKHPLPDVFIPPGDGNDFHRFSLSLNNLSVPLSSIQDLSSQSGIELESTPLSAKALETFRNGSDSSETDLPNSRVFKSFRSIPDAAQSLSVTLSPEKDSIINSNQETVPSSNSSTVDSHFMGSTNLCYEHVEN